MSRDRADTGNCVPAWARLSNAEVRHLHKHSPAPAAGWLLQEEHHLLQHFRKLRGSDRLNVVLMAHGLALERIRARLARDRGRKATRPSNVIPFPDLKGARHG